MTRRTPTTDVALIAGFAALIAVCAILPDIKTGIGIPYSLQTFGVLLTGAVLGPVRGFLSVLLYLVAGLVLPIYSGGASGISHYSGVTAGYLVAFPLAAALCGYLVYRNHRNATQFTLVFTCGLLSSFAIVHTLGPLNLAWRADLSLKEAFSFDAAYFPGDIAKNVVMALIATAVHRAFPDLAARRSVATTTDEPAAQSA
ncbi:biotin transporter BioY [Pimelobacter simplex]|uniref:biotin transporter BioY n=1 Tax=Nocardioides simplex TaxID=2045 RepID=UPI00214F787D|nr:biotin transporter BioY [Pimelobacter simplex]UUW89385.1 biotin transporter BioY [Pimelobacter simplex]UUW93213.1 biotin transporter BioY [Pimelobacter simplex]